MFVAVLLVFLLCQSSAEPVQVKYRCIDSSFNVPSATFTPSMDGVEGRYTAELCAVNKPNVTELSMELTFNNNLSICSKDHKTPRKVRRPGDMHSSGIINIAGVTNCPYVCYSMDFDLIFSSCYQLQSTFKRNSSSFVPYESYHLINNNITKKYYDNNSAHVNFVNHEDSVTLTWYLGRIPAVDYSVLLYRINNNTQVYLEDGVTVTQNCSVKHNVREVQCWLAPTHGCYKARLQHGGSWIVGTFANAKIIDHNFCHIPVKPPEVVGRSFALWWACGAVLLGAGALLAALQLRRALRGGTCLKDIIYSFCGGPSDEKEVEVTEEEMSPPPSRDSRPVLLLYAREGPLGQRAMQALKELIEHSTGGKVFDLFDPEVVRDYARAPHVWLREMLCNTDVRVVLVQSPATEALYKPHVCEEDSRLILCSPMLREHVTYISPQFADHLLLLALQLLAETPRLHSDYHKYYLATYPSVTDILEPVVRFRRYCLPGALVLLVTALSRAAPCPARLARTAAAMQDLLAHAQEHPDYLADELRMVPQPHEHGAHS